MPDREPPPTREQIAALPSFEGLPLARITVVATADEAAAAVTTLLAERAVGFDTESRPTFAKGEVSEGPHLLQFATLDHAYLFQFHHAPSVAAVVALLASTTMAKVGFGLGQDNRQLLAKLGVLPNAVFDLNVLFRSRGYRTSMGVRTAIAEVFGQRFSKSKRTSTSNWSQRNLADRQILYAANDAYAAIRVFAELGAPEQPLLDVGATTR